MVLSLIHGNYFLVLSMSLTEHRCLGNGSWRVTDAVWSTLKPWRNSSRIRAVVSLTMSQQGALQRSDLHNRAVPASASASTNLQLRLFKAAMQRKTSGFLITPSSSGCVGQQKGWKHRNLWNCSVYDSIKAEKSEFDSGLQSLRLYSEIPMTPGFLRQDTFALNKQITSASKAWWHPGQRILLSSPEAQSPSTERLVTRWTQLAQTSPSSLLGHLCQAMPWYVTDTPQKDAQATSKNFCLHR